MNRIAFILVAIITFLFASCKKDSEEPDLAFTVNPDTLIFAGARGEASLGKFAFGKYVCWQVPFMIIGIKIHDLFKLKGLRLKSDNAKCNSCKACVINCPMNLAVMENVKDGKMDNPDCFLCGNCIDH